MGILRNLINRVKKKLPFAGKSKKLSNNSIPLFKFDRMAVESEIASNPDMAQLVSEGEKDHAGFTRLVEDIYGTLYKDHPVLLEEEAVAPEYRPNRKHVQGLMESEDYEKLRENTKMHSSTALASAYTIAKKILDANPKESQDRENVQGLQEELKQLIELAEEAEKIGISSEEEQRIARKIENAEAELDELNEQIQRGANSPYRFYKVTENEVSRAAEETATLMNVLKSLGYTQEELKRISADRMLSMLSNVYNQDKLRRMSDLIGRFRKIAKRLWANKAHEEDLTISGATRGGDISEITSREMMNFLSPTLRFDFLVRWSNNQLEINEREGDMPSGKGPIVFLADVSGSMEEPKHNPKEYFAKALVMALLERARKERRDMVIIYFDSYIQREFLIRKGKIKPEELMHILNFSSGGGTDFEQPLERGVEIISKRTLKDADILLATDGQSRVSQEFVEWFAQERKRLDFKVLSAYIDAKDRWSDPETAIPLLESLSDQVLHIQELTDESGEEFLNKAFN